ncbi:GNAT family N-acetyltransferase [Acuticoccus sp. MNP-M23]|uniref:GNAT family N-acetyltransferase n=1 Tax=Acuticoccus sp. MNP-M23 TaxID=3072793 RepID=UPI002814E8B7|nr:GNAT family N-acetyltransferase [Acuticoccus sp. MNP-M23]WMS44972.1 GNAT family N-acetyltransferase [Acuticoccus sp. MNP-M23]
MDVRIEIAAPGGVDVAGLGGLLHACVMAGASVGFIAPFARNEAEAFWRENIAPRVASGAITLLTARTADDAIAGTAQLITAMPANQPHRADVAKVLVHPDHRRKGIARALMAALEAEARQRNKTLLTLDTRTGDAAEPLYASLGYTTVGVVPDYCIDAFTGALDSTTIMYKRLG